jgi:hypothetical protein
MAKSMTAQEFNNALERLGLVDHRIVADVLGCEDRAVRRYKAGTLEVPRPVAKLLTHLIATSGQSRTPSSVLQDNVHRYLKDLGRIIIELSNRLFQTAELLAGTLSGVGADPEDNIMERLGLFGSRRACPVCGATMASPTHRQA